MLTKSEKETSKAIMVQYYKSLYLSEEQVKGVIHRTRTYFEERNNIVNDVIDHLYGSNYSIVKTSTLLNIGESQVKNYHNQFTNRLTLEIEIAHLKD